MKKTFACIDAHTCGNPVRLVTGGVPFLPGKTIAEKREYFIQHLDWIRTGLMFEPRGHDMMSGAMLFPPTNPENDAAILFIETSGCLPMCGHGTIGTVTIALEEGLLQAKTPGTLRLETPAGLVLARYSSEGNRITSVTITNVPSFLYQEKVSVQHPDLGTLHADIAYGGNFYAIIDPQHNFPGMEHFSAEQLTSLARSLRRILRETLTPIHPENATIRGISHVMWTGKPTHPDSSARNAVFYGEKALDRSPCGTGTSARMAQWHAQGRLAPNQNFIHESIIGSTFTGKIEALSQVGDFPAIIPSISGWARIHGYNTLFIDDQDPYAYGFQVR
ncbi:MAG: 4-hydroxyproline epimerase [Nitritalea sp.]